MRVLIDYIHPSQHWLALARVIEKNPDLPEDVTLVVKVNGVFLRQTAAVGDPVDVAEGDFPEEGIARLEGKLAFLEWLHARFPEQRGTVSPWSQG